MTGHRYILEKLSEEGFNKQYVCRKYANKKFLKASGYAVEWASVNIGDLEDEITETDGDEMLVEE